MQSIPLLPSLSRPLRPGVVAPDKILSMGQIEQNRVLMLNWFTWNRTVYIPSRKLYKLDEPDTQDTAGEAKTG